MNLWVTHKPQQQATLTKKKCPRFSFTFAFVIQPREKPKSRDLYLFSLVIVSVRMVPLPPPHNQPHDCHVLSMKRLGCKTGLAEAQSVCFVHGFADQFWFVTTLNASELLIKMEMVRDRWTGPFCATTTLAQRKTELSKKSPQQT